MATPPSLDISWTSVFGQNNTAAQMLSDIPFKTFEGLQTQGLDTQVAQLEQQIAQIQQQSKAWTLLQTDAQAFVTSANALGDPSVWNATQATSGDTGVANAAADASAVPGTYNVQVQQLAVQEIDGLAPSVALTSTTEALGTLNSAFTAATLAFTVGGATYSVVVTASTSLASLAAALNATGAPVDANIVTSGSASYLEMIGTHPDQPIVYGGSATSAATADWEAVGLLTSTGSVAVVQAAQPALVTMGAASISSATNTIGTLIPGVTLTLNGIGSTAVTVSADPGAGENAVQGLVANWNQWVTDTFSVAWGPMPGTGATVNPYQQIHSDMPMMTLNDLSNQWSDLQIDGESFAALGITWNGSTSGQPTLQANSASLAAALQANPASVAAFFQALASTAAAWANGFATGTDSTTGSTLNGLSQQQQQLQTTITQDNTEIAQIEKAAQTQYLAWATQLTDLASQENQTNAIMGSLLNPNSNNAGG